MGISSPSLYIVTELRIGNYVEINGTNVKLTPPVFALLIEQEIKDPNGIPLTPEWLERFGLTYNQNVDIYFLNHHGFHLSYDEQAEDWNVMPRVDDPLVIAYVKYVHQLQNLYFALTGQELEIKSNDQK